MIDDLVSAGGWLNVTAGRGSANSSEAVVGNGPLQLQAGGTAAQIGLRTRDAWGNTLPQDCLQFRVRSKDCAQLER